MRYLLLFLLSAFLYPLSVLSQASGGEIIRKRTSPVIKQEKRVTQKNATASQIPTIMVVDEALKTCELHSYEDSPCIKESTSGEFSVPEVIDGYTVTQIGERAFFFCTRLNYIKLPPTIKIIKSNAFCRCDWLKSIDIPQGVTEIGRDAFMNCYSLSKINIPNGVKIIGSSAFSFCEKLNQIILPNGLTIIESFTFSNSGLTSITIPSTVKEIGKWAFGHCKELENVICNSLTPPVLGDNAFSGISNSAILYVPVSTKTVYEKTNWNNFFGKIVEKEL